MHTASLVLQETAIIAAGTLAGNEICVGAFVNPGMRNLDDRTRITSIQTLARSLGKAMPFWYAGVLILTGAVAVELHTAHAGSTWLAVVSALLWLGSIVYSLARLVPINNQVSAWDLDSLPADWKQRHDTWDRMHTVRVVVLVVALACLVTACLAD